MAALTEEQYTRGVVIDGLSSQYLSPELAANLLLASMGLQKTCKFIVLSATAQILKSAMGVQPFVLAFINAIHVLFMRMQLQLYVHICKRIWRKPACPSFLSVFFKVSSATDHVLPSFVSKVTCKMNAGVLQCMLRLFHHRRHLHLPRARRQSPCLQLPLST